MVVRLVLLLPHVIRLQSNLLCLAHTVVNSVVGERGVSAILAIEIFLRAVMVFAFLMHLLMVFLVVLPPCVPRMQFPLLCLAHTVVSSVVHERRVSAIDMIEMLSCTHSSPIWDSSRSVYVNECPPSADFS
jgi:hypothetical protein